MEARRPNAADLVERYLHAAARRDIDAMSQQLDDEEVFQTARGSLDKETFLEFVAALFAAFPDWRIDHHEPRTAAISLSPSLRFA